MDVDCCSGPKIIDCPGCGVMRHNEPGSRKTSLYFFFISGFDFSLAETHPSSIAICTSRSCATAIPTTTLFIIISDGASALLKLQGRWEVTEDDADQCRRQTAIAIHPTNTSSIWTDPPTQNAHDLPAAKKLWRSYCSVQNTDGTADNQYYIDIYTYALHRRRELQEAELPSRETARAVDEMHEWEIDFPLADPTTASEFPSSHKFWVPLSYDSRRPLVGHESYCLECNKQGRGSGPMSSNLRGSISNGYWNLSQVFSGPPGEKWIFVVT